MEQGAKLPGEKHDEEPTLPPSHSSPANSAVTSVPSPQGTIEMHVNADCAGTQCTFNTQANLLTPDGPIGFPGDAWARQTVTLRSTNKDTWQEASYSAPAGMPREIKGSNHDNVLSKLYRSPSQVEISATYFGGGPIERFTVDGWVDAVRRHRVTRCAVQPAVIRMLLLN